MTVFIGRISSSGFSSGHRIVIGDWSQSPLGSFTNIMWAKPNGNRVLLSPSKRHAAYVSSLYHFEEVHVVSMNVTRSERAIEVETEMLEVKMLWRKGWYLPFPRPRWFISTVEQFFSQVFFKTRTFGRTRNGIREWYCVQGLAAITESRARMGATDLGKMSLFSPSAGFGFSEPPKKPCSVQVRSLFESFEDTGL